METKELVETLWLNADNTQQGDKVVILDEGQLKEQTGQSGPYQQLVLTVEHNKKNMFLGINRPSHKAIAKKLGTETKNWIGQVLMISHVPTNKYDESGKLKRKLAVELCSP